MNKLLVLVIIALNSVSTQDFDSEMSRHEEDSNRSVAEYLLSYGYNFEEHKIVTPDGYILTLWRIPKRVTDRRRNRPPILLQHGVLDNSFSWLFKRIDNNLPIILVNKGYDVWLGNNRGNIYSKEHVKSSHSWKEMSGRFWDFSFDDMGKYDFPTMVDYVCDVAGVEQIFYVGHSQGALQLFLKATEDVGYVNKHIRAFVGFAPAVFIHHIPGAFEQFIARSSFLDFLYNHKFKNLGVFPPMSVVYKLITQLTPGLTYNIITTITGYTKNHTMDFNRISVMANQGMGGTSMQNILHWVQLMRADNRLQKFDFGPEKNLEVYGRPSPPEYDSAPWMNITCPIHIVIGKADNVMSEEDVNYFMKMLPKHAELSYVEDYGHLDYIWADDAHVKIYPQLLEFLSRSAGSGRT